MRSHWIIAALLSSAIAAGCNGRNNDNSQNYDPNQQAAPANAPAATDQTVAPAPPAQTQQPYSTADNTAVRTQPPATATRATTGRRDAPRSSASSTPQASSTYNNAPAVGLPARENSRAAEAPAPRLPEYREVTIPVGTTLPLEMMSTISSGSAQVEAPVSAKLRNAITVDGDTVIPSGAVLRGNVTDVERAGRVKIGRASCRERV